MNSRSLGKSYKEQLRNKWIADELRIEDRFRDEFTL